MYLHVSACNEFEAVVILRAPKLHLNPNQKRWSTQTWETQCFSAIFHSQPSGDWIRVKSPTPKLKKVKKKSFLREVWLWEHLPHKLHPKIRIRGLIIALLITLSLDFSATSCGCWCFCSPSLLLCSKAPATFTKSAYNQRGELFGTTPDCFHALFFFKNHSLKGLFPPTTVCEKTAPGARRWLWGWFLHRDSLEERKELL